MEQAGAGRRRCSRMGSSCHRELSVVGLGILSPLLDHAQLLHPRARGSAGGCGCAGLAGAGAEARQVCPAQPAVTQVTEVSMVDLQSLGTFLCHRSTSCPRVWQPGAVPTRALKPKPGGAPSGVWNVPVTQVGSGWSSGMRALHPLACFYF